jgi:hypothetical protein
MPVIVLLLVIYAPLAIMLLAWVVLCLRRQFKALQPVGLAALGLATANALFGAGIVAFDDLLLPPWRDPKILFFAVPLAMLLGVVAALEGAPKWLMVLVELASLPLLVLGFYAVEAV